MLDLAIIGGGPAGLTAGLYAARAGLRAVLYERLFAGGQVATTTTIENYPGIQEIEGPELSMRMESQARALGLTISYDEVEALNLAGDEKIITVGGKEQRARAVILCMGATPKELGVPGEQQYRGAGVSYCATCDGAFYKGKKVAVIGGGDTAAEDALFLSNLASEVLLIHRRDELRAARILSDRVLAAASVRPLWNSAVQTIQGEDAVRSIRVQDRQAGSEEEIAVDGVFVAIGTTPQTELVAGQLKLDEQGYIVAGEDTRTSIRGVYAAGDIRQKPLRQVITAASDGAVAVYSAQQDML